MNFRDARTEKIAKMTDKAIVNALLKEDLGDDTRQAFSEMLAWLDRGEGRGLSVKQREWVESALLEYTPIAATDVPRGREVRNSGRVEELANRSRQRGDDHVSERFETQSCDKVHFLVSRQAGRHRIRHGLVARTPRRRPVATKSRRCTLSGSSTDLRRSSYPRTRLHEAAVLPLSPRFRQRRLLRVRHVLSAVVYKSCFQAHLRTAPNVVSITQ